MDHPDIIEVTEIFLVPASILIGAFSVAVSEPLKTGLSVVCLIVAALWLICIWDAWPVGPTLRIWSLTALPLLFLVSSIIASIVHGRSWWRAPSN